MVIFSAIIVFLIVVQLSTGVSYLHHPALKVTRGSDPFAFWLSIGVQGAVVAMLGLGALGSLMNS